MIYELGNGFYVRMLQRSDVDNGPYTSWFEDQKVCKYNSHGVFFKPRETFYDYVDNLTNSDKVVWAICDGEHNHIGNVSLQRISSVDQSADFGIIIGDKRYWGSGVGFLASKMLFFHGFQKLNLRRIWCSTAKTNRGMIALANKLGMVQEGVRRQHLYLEGEWVDLIEFGLLRSEAGNLIS